MGEMSTLLPVPGSFVTREYTVDLRATRSLSEHTSKMLDVSSMKVQALLWGGCTPTGKFAYHFIVHAFD